MSVDTVGLRCGWPLAHNELLRPLTITVLNVEGLTINGGGRGLWLVHYAVFIENCTQFPNYFLEYKTMRHSVYQPFKQKVICKIVSTSGIIHLHKSAKQMTIIHVGNQVLIPAMKLKFWNLQLHFENEVELDKGGKMATLSLPSEAPHWSGHLWWPIVLGQDSNFSFQVMLGVPTTS